MNRPIDIRREQGKVVFEPLEATANDIVFWRNNDREAPHWPALKNGDPMVPYQVPACRDPRQPPTSDGYPLSLSDSEPEKLHYKCKVDNHGSESGEITIYPPPEINDIDLPPGTVGAPYEAEFSATNGKEPYAWSVIVGRLPAGLALSKSKIEGTPTSSGDFSFTIQVADALGSFVTTEKT